MVAVAAFIPVLLHKFQVSDAALWRVASALFLCMAIPFEFVARRRTKDLPKMTLTRFNVNTVNWALSIAADLILVVVLVGLIGSFSESLYLVALFAQLTVSGILFVQFAAETFAYPDDNHD